MLGDFQTLLRDLVANPDRCVENLPLLTEVLAGQAPGVKQHLDTGE